MDRIYNDITTIRNTEGAAYMTFKPLERFEWLIHGFSTRMGGVSTEHLNSLNLGFERGDNPQNVIRNFELLGDAAGFDPKGLSFPNQWHTNNIRIAGKETRWKGRIPEKDDPEIDGQITSERGTVLVTYGADCTPICLVDPINHVIGQCHSGWKGTLNSIACDTVSLMSSEYGSIPQEMVALIGPSISMDAYEVEINVAGPFIEKHCIDVTDNSKIVKYGCKPGKYQLDLWEANRENLIAAGLKPESIYVSGVCTFSEKELMYSHRRDGNARGVMASFMCIR